MKPPAYLRGNASIATKTQVIAYYVTGTLLFNVIVIISIVENEVEWTMVRNYLTVQYICTFSIKNTEK